MDQIKAPAVGVIIALLGAVGWEEGDRKSGLPGRTRTLTGPKGAPPVEHHTALVAGPSISREEGDNNNGPARVIRTPTGRKVTPPVNPHKVLMAGIIIACSPTLGVWLATHMLLPLRPEEFGMFDPLIIGGPVIALTGGPVFVVFKRLRRMV